MKTLCWTAGLTEAYLTTSIKSHDDEALNSLANSYANRGLVGAVDRSIMASHPLARMGGPLK